MRDEMNRLKLMEEEESEKIKFSEPVYESNEETISADYSDFNEKY